MRATASRFTRRRWVVLGLTGAVVALALRAFAQEQAPTRRDVTVSVKDFRFSPARIAVSRNDLVRVTVQSEDVAYSFQFASNVFASAAQVAAEMRSFSNSSSVARSSAVSIGSPLPLSGPPTMRATSASVIPSCRPIRE